MAKCPIKLYFAWPILKIDLPLIFIAVGVLITVGMVTNVARAKQISTRDPLLTVVPSPTDPLLVPFADGTVQTHRFLPCHLRLATEPRHSFAFAIEIMPPLLVRGVVTFCFLGSRASSVVLPVAALFILPEQLAQVDSEKKCSEKWQTTSARSF